jgi:hypothetical protein
MENLDLCRPGVYDRNGSIQEGASYNFYRRQVGYTGPIVKPLSINDYVLTINDYKAYINNWHRNGTYLRGDNGSMVTSSLSFPDLPSSANLYNRLLSKLNEKVRGSLDLSIDLAESAKTAKMLRVTDQVIDYSRTFVGRFGPLKAAGNAYLAYTYGVKPLLSSIFGLADESIRFVLNRSTRYRVGVSESIPVTRVGYYTRNNNYSYISTPLRATRKMHIGIRMLERDFDLSRFTSLNPLSIAYELTPLSFVSDWFFDLGGYLRNAETAITAGGNFQDGYITEVFAFDGECLKTILDPLEWSTLERLRVRCLTIVRNRLTTYPSPRLPTFEAQLGSSRMFSAAALLTQILSGKSK